MDDKRQGKERMILSRRILHVLLKTCTEDWRSSTTTVQMNGREVLFNLNICYSNDLNLGLGDNDKWRNFCLRY